jgi:hypothetical protein
MIVGKRTSTPSLTATHFLVDGNITSAEVYKVGGPAMLGTSAVRLSYRLFAAYQLRRFWIHKNNPVVEI